MSPSMFFNDVEAVKIACNLDRAGMRFYSAMARRTTDPAVQRVFEGLVHAEQAHLKLFEELQQKLLDDPRREAYFDDPELDAYMARLVDTHVFSDEGEVARLAEDVGTDLEALAVGIRAERDTILFYQELLNATDSQAARDVLQQILTEERRHLLALAERSQDCERLSG